MSNKPLTSRRPEQKGRGFQQMSRGLQPARRPNAPTNPPPPMQPHRAKPAPVRRPPPKYGPSHRASLTMSMAISIVLLTSSLAAAADAKRSGAEYLQEGNKLLAAKKYAEALAAYDLAREKLPDAAEVAYDRGIALYRLGRFAEAETAFQDALKPDRPELEAKAKYNLGRCSHAAALAEQEDLSKAIDDLGRAIGFYKDALQVRPDDADAKHNAAIAERLQKYLKLRLAQQKKQEKKKPSSQPGDKKQNDDQSKSDDQQQDDQQQSDDQQKDQDKQQKSDKQEKQQDSNEQKPSSQPKEEEPPATQPSATQPNEEPTTQPMTATSQPTSQPENPKETLRRISIEQAMQMLQEARDAELKRREEKRAQKLRRQGRRHVDKDW